jgi:hypothetical protein
MTTKKTKTENTHESLTLLNNASCRLSSVIYSIEHIPGEIGSDYHRNPNCSLNEVANTIKKAQGEIQKAINDVESSITEITNLIGARKCTRKK